MIHFGGLWLTLRRLPTVTRPTLWIGASFLLRTAVAVGGFYLIVLQGWPATLAAMAGFIAARLTFGHRLRPTGGDR